MKILGIRLENYRTHKETFVDFSSSTITGIIGKTGHGKSSILEAIYYACYGKIRDESEQDVISDGCDYTRVTLDVEHKNQKARIIRKKTKDKSATIEFYLDGVQQNVIGGLKVANKIIEDWIGIDFDTFVAIAFFRQRNCDEFISASPSTRRVYLNSILRNDAIEVASKKFKEQHGLASKKIDELNIGISYLRTNSIDLESCHRKIDEVNLAFVEIDREKKSLESKIEECNSIIESRKNAIDKRNELINHIKFAKSNLTTTGNQLNDFRKRLVFFDTRTKQKNDQVLEWKRSFDEIKTEYDKIDKFEDITSISIDLGEKRSIFGTNRLKKEKLLSLSSRRLCESCLQEIDQTIREKMIENCELLIQESKIQIENLENRLKTAKYQEEIRSKFENIRSREIRFNEKEFEEERNSIVDYIKNLEIGFVEQTEKLNDLTRQHDSIVVEEITPVQNKIYQFRSSLSNLDSMRNSNQRILAEMNYKIQEQKRIDEELKKLNESLIEFQKKLPVLRRLVEAFTVKIPSMVIENVVSIIVDFSNVILKEFNVDYQISVSTIKEIASGEQREQINVSIHKSDGTIRKYDSLSGGQKSIINLAIRVALANLVANNSGVNFRSIFLDEVFSDLDEESLISVLSVINFLKKYFDQIFIVSHIESIKETLPKTIEVLMEGKVSKVR